MDRMCRRIFRRRTGAAMVEFVLVIPLIVVILALLFYFGRLVVRAQHASVMARYEVWRDVAEGAGPRPDGPNGHEQLNGAFFGGNADRIALPLDDQYFPDDPYDEMLRNSVREHYLGSTRLADAWLYRPDGRHRNARGRRAGFHVTHQNTIEMWDRITSIARRDIENPERSPLVRRHIRIGTDWLYTDDRGTDPPRWGADLRWNEHVEVNPHHPRAVRDAFFPEFDLLLDDMDGPHEPEYPDEVGGAQVPGDDFAGMVRHLYLHTPPYRGPRVVR